MKIVVIGGGAAGFFGAIVCAETYPGTEILLLEKGDETLGKVRISGGGRCNVTYACFDPALLADFYPRGGQALRGPFTRFQPRDTVEWFLQHGVLLKTEADGRMFPATNLSQTIVDCLRRAAERAGVRVQTQVSIRRLTHDAAGFVLHLSQSETISADRVLLATGNNREGYRWAEALGHTLVPPVPSLFTFQIADPRLQGLAGLSVARVRAELPDLHLIQIGPVLITHWGLSGPAILKLSAWGARELHDRRYCAELRIHWLPDLGPEQIQAELLKAKTVLARKAVGAQSVFSAFPQRLWERFVESSGIPEKRRWADLTRPDMTHLLSMLQRSVYAIKGKGAFKDEFVTCGGVALDDIQFKTMESRRCPSLYLAGEILDIDGLTGGFNFQNAWTTAYLAGQAMGRLD